MGPRVKAGVGCVRRPFPIPREHSVGQLETVPPWSSPPSKRCLGTFRSVLGAEVTQTQSISQYPPTEAEVAGKAELRGDPTAGGRRTRRTGRADWPGGPGLCRQGPRVGGGWGKAEGCHPTPQSRSQVRSLGKGTAAGGAAVCPSPREDALPAKPASHAAQLLACGDRQGRALVVGGLLGGGSLSSQVSGSSDNTLPHTRAPTRTHC